MKPFTCLAIGSIVAMAPVRAASPVPETISVRVIPTAFCPFCPGYTVTLGPDGQGVFVGERKTAVRGERSFSVPQEVVNAFRKRLRRYRVKGRVVIEAGRPECGLLRTDFDTIEVRWQPAVGKAGYLQLYEGCDGRWSDEVGEFHRALASLPIADLIGPLDATRPD